VGWRAGLMFIYLFVCLFYLHPTDHYKMIMVMSRDYNKRNNT